MPSERGENLEQDPSGEHSDENLSLLKHLNLESAAASAGPTVDENNLNKSDSQLGPGLCSTNLNSGSESDPSKVTGNPNTISGHSGNINDNTNA